LRILDKSLLTVVLKDLQASNERCHGYVRRDLTPDAPFHMNINLFVETLQHPLIHFRPHCSFRPAMPPVEKISSCPMTHTVNGSGFIPRQATPQRVMHFTCALFQSIKLNIYQQECPLLSSQEGISFSFQNLGMNHFNVQRLLMIWLDSYGTPSMDSIPP